LPGVRIRVRRHPEKPSTHHIGAHQPTRFRLNQTRQAIACGIAPLVSVMRKGATVDLIGASISGSAIASSTVEDPIIDMIAVHKVELAILTATDDPRKVLDGLDRADLILYRLLTTRPRSFHGASLLLQHLARHLYDDADNASILADAQGGDGKLKEAADCFLETLGIAVSEIANARSRATP
jgi:hypothetical protein